MCHQKYVNIIKKYVSPKMCVNIIKKEQKICLILNIGSYIKSNIFFSDQKFI